MDGAGKPWVFRFKDLANWWGNPHINRPGGIESGPPTAWVPRSKPVWLTEVGCPAVDKGANQPNVFVDPKSSENALPYFSRGHRDDLIQRRYLEAIAQHFDPAHPAHVVGSNPISPVYGGRMVDPARILAYCWDARPYPAFPYNTEVWGDGDNWQLGHWLTGRFAAGSLQATLAQVLNDYGFADFEIGDLAGVVPGYAVDRVMSARDAIEPLELAFFFDTLESGGRIAFRARGQGDVAAIIGDETLVETRPGASLVEIVRTEETKLPRSAKIAYLDAGRDFESAVAEARRLTGASGRVAEAELPIVLDSGPAQELAESWLYETWVQRERWSFEVPPSLMALEPGDVLAMTRNGVTRLVRITEIGDHTSRETAALSLDPEVYIASPATSRPPSVPASADVGRPEVILLDLPLMTGIEAQRAGYVAARQSPWPGGVSVYSLPEVSGFSLRATVQAPATMGVTLDELPPGPLGVVDRANRVRVAIGSATLQSASLVHVLAGANVVALRTPEGDWEVLQFQNATLVAPGVYELSGLIRGQAGTEHAMRAPLAAGAAFVLIDGAVAAIELAAGETGLPLNWRYGPAARDLADTSYRQSVHTFRAVGLKPYAPVHVRGRRTAGDLAITWVRRTRSGGDGWDGADVPLGEESERYEVDVLDGTAVKRTIATTAPSAVYTAAQQISDFGALQQSAAVRIVQVSGTVGRGTAASVTL